jgi:TetR/AcrR family transcriptional regulator, fatty acid metabolism regulator protein
MADENRIKNKKDRVIDAALRVFAAKGYQNATISEVCKEAGFSEAAIYENFGSKEELLFAIPEKIATEFLDLIQQIMPLIKGVEERMRMFVRAYIQLYRSNPDYSSLCLLQLISFRNFRQTKAYEIMRKTRHILRDCVREGIQTGIFKQDTNPYLVNAMITGPMDLIFIDWHLKGMPSEPDITELLDPLIEMVFESIRVKKEDPSTIHLLKLTSLHDLRGLLQNNDETHDDNLKKCKKQNKPLRKKLIVPKFRSNKKMPD